LAKFLRKKAFAVTVRLRLYGFTYFYVAVTVADFKNSVHSRKICTVLFWIFDLQALSETRSAQTVGKVPVFILQRTGRFFTNALKCFVKSATVTAFPKNPKAELLPFAKKI